MESTTETQKMNMLLMQDEAGYIPVSMVAGKACSSCRWFNSGGQYGDECRIVQNWPEPIVSNGYCNRHEEVPSTEPEPLEVIIVGGMSKKTVTEDSLFSRLWERVEKALPEFLKPPPEPAFTVYKSLSGELRWLATFTNNFQDRDGEIISEKAIDGYLERLQMRLVPMPELWEAHIPETKLGQADDVFAIGNFVHADGHFDNTPENQRPIEYYRKNAAKIPLSHGFTFPKRALKNGVYDEINSFEVTLLPPPLVASNPFTDLEVNESMKQITPEQEAALAQSRGKEFVEKLKAERLAATKDLVEAGIAYKDFADVSTAAAEPTVAAEPDANKPLADLMASVLEDMNELLTTVVGQGKAIKSVMDARAADKTTADAQVSALKTELASLRAELSLTPRRASEAAETLVTEADAKAMIGEAAPDIDPFFS